MRNAIVSYGADELNYEIREIVAVGEELKSLGIPISWENIGDPIAKGEQVPSWIREIVKKEMDTNASYGYSPSKGLMETRQYVSRMRKDEGISLDPEDILFYNGLGDAISHIYSNLNRTTRIIGPNPAYPTHSSAEAAHASAPHITYTLDPENSWLPDLDDLYNKVKYNPNVSGIIIINPDNPTGVVYPKKYLQQIADIAREFNLFLICDEVYANLSYSKEPFTPLYQVVGDDVPAIVMRGLSKEIPWPGARCGWVEFYNVKKDPDFEKYVQSLVMAKMLEVCSTTLPQAVLPKIFSDSRYVEYVREKSELYRRKADIAYNILKDVPGIIAPKPQGAFYMSIVFKDDVLKNNQILEIPGAYLKKAEIQKYLEEITQDVSPDKRFAYHLMASTGICVVPLTGFNSHLYGFRLTLLENDMKKFEDNIKIIARKIEEYLES
jgi:alanine-synthesizing transaminase